VVREADEVPAAVHGEEEPGVEDATAEESEPASSD
jgi:hypothetical protein